MRPTRPDDDGGLADLLASAYDGASIDFDPEADYYDELRDWRTIDHADDAASRIAHIDDTIVGASLIGAELGAPFLYEVAVAPSHQRQGLARFLLSASINELADRGAPAITAWVTAGNTASEHLLTYCGFRPTTLPLVGALAVGIYSAAAAAADLDQAAILATAAEPLAPGTVRLSVITDIPFDEWVIRVRDSDVHVRAIAPGGKELTTMLTRATPLSGYEYLSTFR